MLKKKKKKAPHYPKKGWQKMRSREIVFESSCLPLWNIFFPPFKTPEKVIKKKTLNREKCC